MAFGYNQAELDPLKQPKAALYLRVSTTEQAVHGYSLAAQEQVIRQFCQQRGYEVYQVYADEGISGKRTENRPAFQRMMTDARESLFDMVVVWKLSRLGRNNRDILNTTEELYKNNVSFYSISEQFDVSTSTGRLMLQLLGSFGEFERNQISENVQLAMRSLVRDQKRFAGGRMLGYVSSKDEQGKKILVIEKLEAEIVRFIFQEYSKGKGYRAIANELNRQELTTVKGNTFSTIAVKDILMNKTYGGYLEYAKYVNWEEKRRKGKNPQPIVVEGEHEPIIEKELFDKVQTRLKVAKKQPQWNERGENLLTGLLRCPECHGPMAASNTTNTLKDGTKKRIRYYSCANFRNKGAKVCHANSIRADVAEKFVADRLKEVIQVPKILEGLVKELNIQMKEVNSQYESELSYLQVKATNIEEKLSKWNNLLEDSPEMIVELDGRVNELQNQKIMNQEEQNQLKRQKEQEGEAIKVTDITVLLNGVEGLLKKGTTREVKQIYQCFIKEITFNKDTKADIQMTLYFDEAIVDQLNKSYQEAISRGDVAIFVFRDIVEFII
jgi:site-specific DNA recombinase